jgi:hypothetical protein
LGTEYDACSKADISAPALSYSHPYIHSERAAAKLIIGATDLQWLETPE